MPKLLRAVQMDKCIACGSCMLTCARTRYQSLSLDRSAIRIRTAGGFRGNPVADICLGCIEPPCVVVCPSGALRKRKGGGVVVSRDKCIGCNQCTGACSVRGIRYDDSIGYPVVCVHCGNCAKFCPHDCLALVDVEDDRTYDAYDADIEEVAHGHA